MTAAGPGYRLVLPEGWWALDLEPGRWPAQVAALVERQWRGVDDAPHLKAQARAELDRVAADAARAGGVQLFLSVGALAGVPLSASLLVSRLPAGGPAALEGLAGSAAAAGREVTRPRLPAGPALRTRWRRDAGSTDGLAGDLSAAQAEALTTTCVDVHLPVPGSPELLVLQFRTGLAPLADALVELFDAVAGTLRWTGTGPVDDGSTGLRPL